MISTLSQRDPEGAAGLLEEQGITAHNSHHVGDIFASWMREDRDAITYWTTHEARSDPRRYLRQF